jgi:hypothetical protein
MPEPSSGEAFGLSEADVSMDKRYCLGPVQMKPAEAHIRWAEIRRDGQEVCNDYMRLQGLLSGSKVYIIESFYIVATFEGDRKRLYCIAE